jgi:hypothetical protein
MWKVKNTIKSQNSCAALGNFDDNMRLGKIIGGTEISVKEILFNCKLRQHKLL